MSLLGMSKSRNEPFVVEERSRKSLWDFPEAFLQHVCSQTKQGPLSVEWARSGGGGMGGDLEIAPFKMPERPVRDPCLPELPTSEGHSR